MAAKPHRIAVIDALPTEMQDHALVGMKDAAALLNVCVPQARKIIRDAGIPLVELTERKKLPRWGALRDFLMSRETVAA